LSDSNDKQIVGAMLRVCVILHSLIFLENKNILLNDIFPKMLQEISWYRHACLVVSLVVTSLTDNRPECFVVPGFLTSCDFND